MGTMALEHAKRSKWVFTVATWAKNHVHNVYWKVHLGWELPFAISSVKQCVLWKMASNAIAGCKTTVPEATTQLHCQRQQCHSELQKRSACTVTGWLAADLRNKTTGHPKLRHEQLRQVGKHVQVHPQAPKQAAKTALVARSDSLHSLNLRWFNQMSLHAANTQHQRHMMGSGSTGMGGAEGVRLPDPLSARKRRSRGMWSSTCSWLAV